MLRCVKCGSSKLDSRGMGCARCGGAPAVPWEQVYVDDDTKATLLEHADDLKQFGVNLEEQQLLRKDAATTMAAIGLGLTIAESLHPHLLRDLVLYLRDLTIPEEQILRLRLDEPDSISQILNEPPKKSERKSARKNVPSMMKISRQSVEQAMDEIDRVGIPANRRSTKFCLAARGLHYPPKCVLRLAYRFEYGEDLKRLSGGSETNAPLRDAGFDVLECPSKCGNTCKTKS